MDLLLLILTFYLNHFLDINQKKEIFIYPFQNLYFTYFYTLLISSINCIFIFKEFPPKKKFESANRSCRAPSSIVKFKGTPIKYIGPSYRS